SQIMLAVERLFNEGKIYVDDERKWNFSQVASFMDIDIDDEEEEDYVGLENFDHMELRVLMFLSICDIPVIDEIIMEVLDLTAEEFEDVILQLKETQVVDSKFSDWGFSYYVDNRVLKRELAAMIPKIDRLEYNKKIAMYLESKYLVDKKYLDDRLIYHLEQSEEHEKCASYSLIYAERLKNFSLKEAQSLIYYNKALQHAKAVDNDALTLSTHLAIGDIYQETDQFDEALMNYKSAEILAAKNEDIEKKIDAINKIGVIELKRLNYDESKRLFLYTNKMSRMEHYKVGEVRSAVHLVDYYFERQMYKQAMTLIDYYIPLCDSEVYHRNLGHLYHRKAAYYYMGDFYLEAKECYEKAVDVLTGSGNEDIMSLCLNNLGAVELEYLGNSKKALEFFMMAEDLDLRNNIFNDLAVFKANIGAAYFKLDQHEKAIETYEQAITMAMESNDKRDFFIITKEVIRDYGVYGYFDKAYSLLKKLEIDYSSAMHVAKYHDQHDFMNIEYYLLLENYDMAYKWYVKYKSHKLSNHSRGFSIKLLETIFEENHLQTTDNVTESLLWRLSQLRDSAVSVLDYQLLRNFTLRMAKKLLTTNNYILIKKFVDYDTTLIPFFDSAFLRLYHAIFEALFSENRIEGFVALTHTYTDKKYDRINWIGHKLLANEYHQAGSYYKAMVHYTTALDMVKGLTYLLPDDLKRSFIVHDALKLQMKNRISELFGKIIHGRGIDSMLMIESEINSVEEFFDISSLNSLFKNDRFSQDVYEAVFKDQFDQVMAVEDVVSKMEHYSESNIYNILTYYMQILCADYGRIVFKDNNNEIYKRFDLGKPCSNDIDFIKNSLYYENEGVFVNVNEESLYSYLLKDGRKSILYIPIFERISHKEKEAINEIAYENEIGYVYLESNKVLNNFNADNFEKCRLMLNLVKAILENYRLKILSSIDKLTGVYLRKYTEERFSEQLVLARRENAELSVIMCDIDKFKYVNDTYGHLKGDEILRRIGRILNEIVEPYGLVGRYGGEEFIAILPNISLEDAMKISESVRMRIQEEIRVEARKPVTISLGVSSYPNHGLSEEELVENADKALYYSKNTGRNKSTAWSKEISGAHYRFDRLAGILTGNSAVDATNMQSIVEIIAMLKLNLDKNGKLLKVLENLIDITKAEMAYVVELNPSGDRCVYMKERGANQLNLAYQPDLNLLDKYLDAQTGDYFVNWDDVRENDFEEQMPDWRSIIVTPLFDGVRSKGIVVVEVPIIEREFDFNNYNYVNLMSGLISAII
ncbi:MAG: diguanylate cyclase, partial [Clostridia bacterium]|nr:diguanylate cyclase [Clostridia bacterium]